MNWQLVSLCIIIAAPVLIGAYDLIVYLAGGVEATISYVAFETSRKFPLFCWNVCFLFGLLGAHLFTSGPYQKPPLWVALTVLVALPVLTSFLLLIVGVHMPEVVTKFSNEHRLAAVLVWLGLGAVAGYAFLP